MVISQFLARGLEAHGDAEAETGHQLDGFHVRNNLTCELRPLGDDINNTPDVAEQGDDSPFDCRWRKFAGSIPRDAGWPAREGDAELPKGMVPVVAALPVLAVAPVAEAPWSGPKPLDAPTSVIYCETARRQGSSMSRPRAVLVVGRARRLATRQRLTSKCCAAEREATRVNHGPRGACEVASSFLKGSALPAMSDCWAGVSREHQCCECDALPRGRQVLFSAEVKCSDSGLTPSRSLTSPCLLCNRFLSFGGEQLEPASRSPPPGSNVANSRLTPSDQIPSRRVNTRQEVNKD